MTTAARRTLLVSGGAIAVIGLCLLLRNLLVPDPLEQLRLVETRADGSRVLEGSWQFPRGGPYMVGFESPAPGAELYIDGVRIVPRPGQLVVREPWRGQPVDGAPRSERGSYHPGVVGVRFVAPPGARLLWIPPGRRSDPEYVPPSSLAPEPPEQASFGSWAGARPLDGLFAGVIALTGLAWLGFLFRRRLRAVDRRVALAAAGVLALALLVRLVDLGGAGETWDENTNWSAGRNYVTNLLSLDFSQESWRWNFEHPPVMKYIAGLGAQWADGYGPARALSALMSALACGLLVFIGRRLWSLRVGVYAGVIAALTPHLIAHGKIVGHETPTVLWWTLASYLCIVAFDRLDPADRRQLGLRFAGIGVVLGLAISSRFANLLLAPLIGSVLLVQAPAELRKRTVATGLAIIPAVAVVVSVMLWPRMWSEPLAHLSESWARLSKPHSPEPFLGQITNLPPRYYFAVYLGATAPLGVLIAVGAWLARVVRKPEQASLVAALLLVVPMLILLSPVRQDGVRYIMPSLVALALIAAVGLDFLLTFAAEELRSRAGWAVGGAMALYLAITCYRVHPYYLDYYGEQVGGPARVADQRSFEIAWWGEGLGSAIDYVNDHAEPRARVFKGCISPYDHLGWLRGDLWQPLARNPQTADWMIVYQPTTSSSLRGASCRVPSAFSLAYEVSVSGAPVARVYRRAASGASPPR